MANVPRETPMSIDDAEEIIRGFARSHANERCISPAETAAVMAEVEQAMAVLRGWKTRARELVDAGYGVMLPRFMVEAAAPPNPMTVRQFLERVDLLGGDSSIEQAAIRVHGPAQNGRIDFTLQLF